MRYIGAIGSFVGLSINLVYMSFFGNTAVNWFAAILCACFLVYSFYQLRQ